jgi:hypothetical protein
MIRAPIPDDVVLAWWRSALAEAPDAIPDEPRAGFFKRKLVKGGVYVPARIWLEQEIGEDGELLGAEFKCEVNGEPADPFDQWSYLCGEPISEAEFKYLTARGDWAWRYAPNDPAARPRERIDHLSSPVMF